MNDKNKKIIALANILLILLTACGFTSPSLPTVTPAIKAETSTPTSIITVESTSTAIWSVPFGSEVLDDYIGLEMPPHPYPSIYPLMGGWLLDDKPYGLTLYLTQDKGSGLILFSRLLYRDSKTTAHWLILDAVVLNKIPINENFYSNCSMNGVFRTDLIALGKVNPNDGTKPIIERIWQADTTKESFQELDPKLIECIVKKFG